MLTQFRFENFKSWRDTGEIRMAPLTGFFGTNSSGKTSILQFLLMLKQTVESIDRSRILELGEDSPNAYVNLGSQSDIIHHHQLPGQINFSLTWKLYRSSNNFHFSNSIDCNLDNISVSKFNYQAFVSQSNQYLYGLGLKQTSIQDLSYTLLVDTTPFPGSEPYEISGLSAPHKGHEFPTDTTRKAIAAGHDIGVWPSHFIREYEDFFEENLYYLGPLREYPRRLYQKIIGAPIDLGLRGEYTIRALLSRYSDRQNLVVKIARCLKQLKLIDDFRLHAIAENRNEYEVRVRRTAKSPEVLITDVGFGVSQILPVLVLCYYVSEGSTIIFEQPEIHLHPSVQAGLADVFIDVIKTRNVQIILESHSEHLLRRLQRRIAEEHKDMKPEDAALYFCSIDDTGTSKLTELELDTYGNINNWPQGFFGDEMGDLVAMTEAAIRRQTANN
jgi:AAA15 family ATPase/GTPase